MVLPKTHTEMEAFLLDKAETVEEKKWKSNWDVSPYHI